MRIKLMTVGEKKWTFLLDFELQNKAILHS